MSTHNICFRGEIRKILCGYPLLSVAMYKAVFSIIIITIIGFLASKVLDWNLSSNNHHKREQHG